MDIFFFFYRLTAYSDPNLATKSIRVTSLNSTTVEFLAPEMIECTYATFATDAWNVGIIGTNKAFKILNKFLLNTGSVYGRRFLSHIKPTIILALICTFVLMYF